ncbi:caspase family protein [Pleurocapsales cyanobacterium LEGE 10410]|nr:caspase family protein [Pleurocapsales cyanobacterium LEGE 10410]
MKLDRRTFLQQAGLALFTWGATEAGISSLVNNNHLARSIANYQQTLAQPTNRKLALLVGINRYPNYEHLTGCLTDIELQRELLIHRFGFNPSDIITLSDRLATRENIETTFIEHLGQAKADDVVVFHFSGYGGQIKMPLSVDGNNLKAENTSSPAWDSPGAFRLVNSFIPVNGVSSSAKKSRANGILQESLLVLAQSLSTAKCTFVLDTSFNTTSASKHSNLKIRSVSQVFEDLSPQELAFLAELNADLASKGLKASKRVSSLPGVVLSASGKNQVAAERQWDSFSAGLFTHALTRHLWQITPSSKMQLALARSAETVEQVMGRQQQPSLNSTDKMAIAYYLAASDAPQAIGVISKADNNNNIELKLLGLPANILDCYEVNSCFSSIPNNVPQLQLKSQEGLVAKTKLLSTIIESPQVGQLVNESLRMLKRDLKLTLAMDFDLERIERVDATSALANIPAISSAIVSGEQHADCLLGKVSSVPTSEAITDSETKKPTFSYGLYTAGGVLIDKTTGLEEEAVKIAIDRLQPQFNNLLTAKWLELTNNEFSSQLKVSATLTAKGEKPTAGWRRTTFPVENQQLSTKKTRFATNSLNTESANASPFLAKGAEIELTLNNFSDRQLYALLLGVDSDSDIFALYTPIQPSKAEAEARLENIAIAPGNKLVIPPVENSWQWKAPESAGINTLYAIFAVQPFANTLKALTTQPNFKLDREQVLKVTNPLEVVNSLMQDLHNASSVADSFLPKDDVYALDVNSWATLNFVYEVANL